MYLSAPYRSAFLDPLPTMSDTEQQQQDAGLEGNAAIEVSAIGRRVLVPKQKAQAPIRIHAQYISRLIQAAHPSRMVDEVVIQQLLPELAAALPEWQLVWSYKSQLKPLVINARAVFAQPISIDDLGQQLATHSCSCCTVPTAVQAGSRGQAVVNALPQCRWLLACQNY